MSTRRSSIVRLTASALLSAAVALGAHAFVPTAFGCGLAGTGNCRETSGGTTSFEVSLEEIRVAVELVSLYIP